MKTANNKRVILIADDDEDMLHLMDFKLSAEGFTTLISQNGENLMDIITQTPPDLVLLDIKMKGINGDAICRKIKAAPETTAIPVVMFSSSENIESIARNCGADAYIKKPFDTQLFMEIFRRVQGAN